MKIVPLNSIFTSSQILQFRQDTEGTKHIVHLNNAGAALMPDVVTNAQLNHLKLESQIGGYEAAARRSTEINGFYEEAAQLFHCKVSNIAFTASATDSYVRALSSIPFNPGDVILTDNDDYISNQIQFLSLAKRLGIKLIRINNAGIGGVDLNDLHDKLRVHQPKLLAITHIPTNSGLVQPVLQIGKIFREFVNDNPEKSWYILDGCQSAGQLSLDVSALHCDFLSTTCRKFLRGPRGAGILYVSDKALSAGLEPMFLDMRGAEWIQKDEYRPRVDATRFEDWEFNYASVIGTKEAIRYCRQIGEDKIWSQITALSTQMRERLSAINKIKVLDRGPELGGLVTFHAEGANPKDLVSKFSRRKINVVASHRGNGVIDFDEKGVDWAIRASPHYYNTQEEIDTFIDSVKEIVW